MEHSILSQQIMLHIQKKKKSNGFEKAPFGIVGLETAFPLFIRTLLKQEI